MTNRSETLQPQPAKKEGTPPLLANLVVETLSGLEIIRPDVSQLSAEVAEYLCKLSIPDTALRAAIDQLRSLREAYKGVFDYWDAFACRTEDALEPQDIEVVASAEREGWFSVLIGGVPYIDDADSREAAEVLVKELLELESAYPSESYAFPIEVPDNVLYGLITLLQIDSAVAHMNSEKWDLAVGELMHAVEAREAMLHPERARLLQERAREEAKKQVARAGGLATQRKLAVHRRTYSWKRELLQKWDAGEFASKAEAARWVTSHGGAFSPRVVERWIRAHEKEKTVTKLVK